MMTITDARGITTSLNYDGLERITSKTFPNSIPGKIEDVAYSYDTCNLGTGRLCRRTDESGIIALSYIEKLRQIHAATHPGMQAESNRSGRMNNDAT
jgi:YD repeat-containing protein